MKGESIFNCSELHLYLRQLLYETALKVFCVQLAEGSCIIFLIFGFSVVLYLVKIPFA